MALETKRLQYVDVFKGIAIVMIVVYHLLAPCLGKTIVNHLMDPLLVSFFFFSGFFYKPGRRSVSENIKNRAKSLMIPFFRYSLFFWLVGTVYLVATKRMNKRMIRLSIAVALFCIIGTVALAGETESELADSGICYVHDPRENAEAMADIIENPDAVYGFSPDPQSQRLGSYAEYDWTDPEVVAEKQEARNAYHESKASLIDILYKMREEGASIEEMARAVSKERNRLRLEAYKDDPKGLALVKESNLKIYGHEDGPTPDEMYEKCGSWTEVMKKSFGINMGMDACCGLYDDYYWLYEELGYVKED